MFLSFRPFLNSSTVSLKTNLAILPVPGSQRRTSSSLHGGEEGLFLPQRHFLGLVSHLLVPAFGQSLLYPQLATNLLKSREAGRPVQMPTTDLQGGFQTPFSVLPPQSPVLFSEQLSRLWDRVIL